MGFKPAILGNQHVFLRIAYDAGICIWRRGTLGADQQHAGTGSQAGGQAPGAVGHHDPQSSQSGHTRFASNNGNIAMATLGQYTHGFFGQRISHGNEEICNR